MRKPVRPVKVMSWPLSSINDRARLFLNILLQTIEICAEWLNHMRKGGHAVWANVLRAYAQLHLADRPHKLHQVTTHTSFHKLQLLNFASGAFVHVSVPSSLSPSITQAWCTTFPGLHAAAWSDAASCTYLLEMQLFTLISNHARRLSRLAGAMLQVADDLVQVIKLVAEHPEAQLASIALPGLPADIKGYVSGVETVVSGVRFIADAWDSAIRYACSLGCVLYLPIHGDMPSNALVMQPYVACQAHA